MKQFFLNDTSHQLDVEISPTLVDTLDESLDNMTISLKINKDKDPYAPVINRVLVYDLRKNPNHGPGQPLFIQELINDFVVTSDTVELVTENPLRYKHTLSLVQRSQYLTKHIGRNTVFSNELESLFDEVVSSRSFIADYEQDNTLQYSNLGTPINGQYNLTINKVKSLKIKPVFSFQQRIKNEWQETVYGENHFETYTCKYIKPTRWKDIYAENENIGAFPVIEFSIDNNGVVDSYQFNMNPNANEILNDEFIDNNSQPMRDLLTFLQTHNEGTLTISVLNYSDQILVNGWNDCVVVDVGTETWQAEPLGTTKQIMYFNFHIEVYFNSISNTVYDVIETLVNQYKKNTKAYNDHVGSSGYDSSIKPLFKMPDDSSTKRAELKELLQNTQAPNFVFTQASMFDALSEIFRLFDATFRIDEDGYLEIEYFNNRDIQDKFELTNSMKAGRSSSLGEERYANRLVTFFQNAKINDKFPNSNEESATAYIRSKTLGTPSYDDYVFITPKPINLIKNAIINASAILSINDEVYHSTGGAPYLYYYGFRFESLFDSFDITENIVREDIWSILPNSNDTDTINKSNTLTYKEGDKYIEVGKYFTKDNQTQELILRRAIEYSVKKRFGNVSITITTPAIQSARLAVEYIALVDGKLVNESIDNKYDGEILTNQNNGSIDINKLGLNMVGLSLKLGQPTLTMTQTFTDWVHRIRKGQWFVEDGEIWVANNCSYTLITPVQVQATIEFVKNFNGLASRIELNREKRLTNISNELTVKCEETYGEFIYFDDGYEPNEEMGENIALNNNVVMASLLNTIGENLLTYNPLGTYDPKIEFATITALNDDNSIITLSKTKEVANIVIPMVIYASGNSICFEMSFDSPISAGNRLVQDSNLWDGGWFSSAVLYTNENGTASKFTIEFVDLTEDLTHYFPALKKNDNNEYLDFEIKGKLEQFEYYKKPNEIFALNYQLHFLPYDQDCFISNEFIKNNAFSEGMNKHSFHLVYTLKGENEQEYSILDTKGIDDYEGEINQISYEQDNHSIVIKIAARNMLDVEMETIKTWALVDENNNIYFASNKSPETDYFTIRFFWRHHRLV